MCAAECKGGWWHYAEVLFYTNAKGLKKNRILQENTAVISYKMNGMDAKITENQTHEADA